MISKALSKIGKELAHHESIINDGLKSFEFVGNSLRTIRHEKLYQENYDTFESYCKTRWNISRPRAYQMIEAACVVENLSTIVDTSSKDAKAILPSSESQARALASSADDSESQAKVWKAVVKESDGKPITAAAIKRKADEILPPKIKEEPKPKDEPVESRRDKRTEFNPGDFDPEMKDESSKEVGPSQFAKKLELIETSVEAVYGSLGPLIRALDNENDQSSIPNYKSIVAHYQRFHKEFGEARTTLIQLSKAWKFRK